MLVEKEADRPYLTGLERSFCSNLTPGVPRYPLASGGIKLRLSHDTSPMAVMTIGRTLQERPTHISRSASISCSSSADVPLFRRLPTLADEDQLHSPRRVRPERIRRGGLERCNILGMQTSVRGSTDCAAAERFRVSSDSGLVPDASDFQHRVIKTCHSIGIPSHCR